MIVFKVKDCCLFINNEEVKCQDDMVVLAGLLSIGDIPSYLEKYDLSDSDIERLEKLLSQEIFLKGKCLPPSQ